MNTPQPRTHTLRLLLGDQLNPEHSWFAMQDDGVVYVLMEVRQETDYVLHHAQKILAIFAAMRDLARQLREAGHRVRYVTIDDASNRQSIPDNLAALMAHYGAHTLQYQHPDEWRLDEQLSTWGAEQPFEVQAVSSEHFYTTRTEMAEVFKGRKQWLMEHFYRRMRQRHGVLIDEAGEPEGGQWNYDHDNRKPWPGTPALPPDARPTHDHGALWATLQAAGVQLLVEPPFVGVLVLQRLRTVVGHQGGQVVGHRLAVAGVVNRHIAHAVPRLAQVAGQVAHGSKDGEDFLRVVQHVVGLLPHFHQHVDHAIVARGKPAVLGIELIAQQ